MDYKGCSSSPILYHVTHQQDSRIITVVITDTPLGGFSKSKLKDNEGDKNNGERAVLSAKGAKQLETHLQRNKSRA